MSAFAPVGNGLVLCYVVARPNERLAYVRGSNVVRVIAGESETRVAAIGAEIEVAARGDGWPLEFDPPPLGGATRAAIGERIAELGDRGAIADVYARSVLVIAQHQTRAGGFIAPHGQDVLLAHALDVCGERGAAEAFFEWALTNRRIDGRLMWGLEQHLRLAYGSELRGRFESLGERPARQPLDLRKPTNDGIHAALNARRERVPFVNEEGPDPTAPPGFP